MEGARRVVLADIPGLTSASQLSSPAHLQPETKPKARAIHTLPINPATGWPTRSDTHSRILPVTSDIKNLFPRHGLATGTILQPDRGATSLLWRLLSQPSAAHWCALVGLPHRHLPTAAEAGVNLEHLVTVDVPSLQVADASAALLEGFAVVALPTSAFSPRQASRLVARARRHGTVLLWWGQPPMGWPGTETTLQVTTAQWHGLRAHSGRRFGSGRIGSCELAVSSRWRSGRLCRATVRLDGQGVGS